MKTRLKGVIQALPTPFDADGEIDEAALRGVVRFMLGKGVHGMCVGGSTGEGHTLEKDEFRRLNAIAMEEVQGRVPVVAGIIANSTREVIARARAVADLGVEAVQVTPPFYVFTPDEPRQPMAYPTAAQQAESAPLLRALLAAYDPAR